ncbi:hypothetical protein [Salegentibacter salarius]|uniref:Uncharacterized protein n=1 Tax=Salegentibacter salarius TaxID=435906 RepID=A0A2N0TMH3_9FLAO|nr:hypothetical protein [Salegentibacter salarius]OEY71416.1 hypothetical protein BHS39_05800 [Salegentibacter salarius]PKD15945.1 hypothetical protein APR40_05795 [Salegentibacter salarius]SLJ91752.1 hypothetical protein SAMN05660445_01171 [Salegentibacter salarius]HKL36672.1 hypothetical protein [Salegentibacter sp.]
MNNIKAQKLLNKIQRDLMRNGIITNTLVNDLKELRPLVVEEGQPLLAKVIRLTYEHVDAYDSFNIAIPGDDPVEEGEEAPVQEETTGQESLDYLLSLMADPSNRVNEIELREYVNAFNEYAEEN